MKEETTPTAGLQVEDIKRVIPLIRSLYLGQEILYEVIFGEGSANRQGKLSAVYDNGDIYVDEISGVSDLLDEDNYPVLFLRPLSSIIDDEAVQVSKIFHMGYDSFDEISYQQHCFYGRYNNVCKWTNTHVYQYLIQQGFAIPFYDSVTNTTITVEQQIEYGIIKLKS